MTWTATHAAGSAPPRQSSGDSVDPGLRAESFISDLTCCEPGFHGGGAGTVERVVLVGADDLGGKELRSDLVVETVTVEARSSRG